MRRAALLLVATLAGCGFHPRGAEPLPPQLNRIAVHNVRAGALLRTETETALASSGARIVSSREAQAVVNLIEEGVERRLLSVDSSGKASEYQVQYRVSFELLAPSGVAILPVQTVVATREYPYDRRNPLAMENQEEMLSGEMRGLAVAQIVRRLRTAQLPAESR